jgi:pSer/pThr/pTyr-binding forkhead associated (FHA) protein/soluble lytic murein transglycosylase-like protein
MPRLIVRIGDHAEREVEFGPGRIRLGRAPECEVPIDDDGISRVHAWIDCQGDRCEIADAGSRNGTFLNGARVERAAFAAGDRVRLGQHAEIELIDEHEGPAVSPARRKSGGRRMDYALVPVGRAASSAVRLRQAVTTVGRDPSAGISIDHESVSRMHARLDREADTLVVVDLKSRNGTFVNGESVMRAELSDGDEIRFGEIRWRVRARPRSAWRPIAAGTVAALALAGAVYGLSQLAGYLEERRAVAEQRHRLEAQALASLHRGIDASQRGDADFAQSYLTYAAEMLLLSDQAPSGATLSNPNELFRVIARKLPPEERDFDFARALDARAIASARERLEDLSDQDYVGHQVQKIAIALGQSQNVPQGFVDQVWAYVQQNIRYPGKFQATLERAATLQPVLREGLTQAHLPESFCYVAWIESDLIPVAHSPAGAVGLWQLMAGTARERGLRVVAGGPDERTDPVKSTRAAAGYIGSLMGIFGREQFMCVLASYNRGPGAVQGLMARIGQEDPMMESGRKYWLMVERGWLPNETSEYVSRIFAYQVMAESPQRFGFERP